MRFKYFFPAWSWWIHSLHFLKKVNLCETFVPSVTTSGTVSRPQTFSPALPKSSPYRCFFYRWLSTVPSSEDSNTTRPHPTSTSGEMPDRFGGSTLAVRRMLLCLPTAWLTLWTWSAPWQMLVNIIFLLNNLFFLFFLLLLYVNSQMLTMTF